jgi:hypothetical protein
MKTSKEGGERIFLDGLLTGDASGAIESQEARGQTSFVNSTDLPVSHGIKDNRDDVLLAWGIKLGEPHEGDPIFRPAELPDGWEKQPTDHAMWSKLVDDEGRERASIFYKAAFYDRSSHIALNTRFTVQQNLNDFEGGGDGPYTTKVQFRVLDCGKVVFSTEPVDTPVGDDGREDYRASDVIKQDQRAACEAWLRENGYMDWQDPAKYWDEQ